MVVKILLRLVFWFIVAIVSVETGLRLLGYPASYSALFTQDELVGYRFAPGPHSFFAGDAKYSVFVDRYGIIDHVGIGRAEVVILGDGVVAGLELPKPQRLAYSVNASTGLKTVNLSVPGYGTVQQYLTLRRWISQFGPPDQLFIIFNYGSDFLDNVPSWEGAGIPGVDQSGDEATVQKPEFLPPAVQQGRELLRKSRIITVFTSLLRKLKSPVEEIPMHQLQLFSAAETPELIQGTGAMVFAVEGILELATEHNFEVTWLSWLDAPLLQRAGLSEEDILRGELRMKAITGNEATWQQIIKEIAGTPDEVQRWEQKWLHTDSRHASRAAIERMAAMISIRAQLSTMNNEPEMN